MRRRLSKSEDRKLFGGDAGLAEYFGLHPTLARAAFILLTAVTGSGPLVYLVLAIIMHSPEINDS